MTKNFDFIDDLTTANARIAEQETRLGLSKSASRIDILDANTVLGGLRLMETPEKAPAPPIPAPPITAAAPAIRQTKNAPRHAADGNLHGVALLAAHYAKHALPSGI